MSKFDDLEETPFYEFIALGPFNDPFISQHIKLHKPKESNRKTVHMLVDLVHSKNPSSSKQQAWVNMENPQAFLFGYHLIEASGLKHLLRDLL
jgi:hypothetical protein